MSNAFDAVRAFEIALAEYCEAPAAVATTSCTDALLACCMYHGVGEVEIPKLTFVGVAMAILNAGGTVKFRDEDWQGCYRLAPYPIIDAARSMWAGMYVHGSFMCLSFHASKILSYSDGGAILCSTRDAGALRRLCYDGRSLDGPWRPEEFRRGIHAFMAPSTAAGLHRRLMTLPRENAHLPRSDYPDLSKFPLFQNGGIPHE